MTSQKIDKPSSLLALLLLVPAPSIGVIAAMVWFQGTLLGQGIFMASKVWLVLLPVIWWRWVDRQPLSGSTPKQGGFVVGAILGLAISAVILGGYFLLGQYWIDAEQVRLIIYKNGLNSPLIYLAGAIYWITLNSILEEYVWRWFVFEKCKQWVGGLGAVFASALFFTIHHSLALTFQQFDWRIIVLGSLGVFVGGVVWSGLYFKYKSIWPGYLSHAIVDIPIFVIGWILTFGTGST